MTSKTLIIIFLTLFITISGIGGYLYLAKRPHISDNILILTTPVRSFSGIIEKIDGNTITVSHQQLPNLKYQVNVLESTIITQPTTYTKYLFKSNDSPPTPPTSIASMEIGQKIAILSSEDLRTLKGNRFDAITIDIAEKNNIITGNITQIENNKIIIKSNIPTTILSVEDESTTTAGDQLYTITLTPETEISSILRNPDPSPVRHSPSDLKLGTSITVYTNLDITKNTSFEALRIEPIFPESVPLTSATLPPLTSTPNTPPTPPLP